MRSTPVEHSQSFTSPSLTQPPISAANQNAGISSRRGHSEIWGLYKLAQSDPRHICIQKHKQGETTTAKCPNCGQNHHAWYKRCPARIQRIQDSTPAPPTTSRNVRPPTMEKTNKPEPQQPQPQPASTTRRPNHPNPTSTTSSQKPCHLQSN